jgi:hypothetical protein
MGLQQLLERGGVGDLAKSRRERLRVLVDEPALDERLDQMLLRQLLLDRLLVLEAAADGGPLAVHQQVGQLALPVALQRVLELPLRTGHRLAGQRSEEPVGRQRNAQARPQDHHHNVGLARRRDLVLEMLRGGQRLALPKHRLDPKVIGELPAEASDHPLGDQPFRPHVAGRGDENPQKLGFGHGPLGEKSDDDGETIKVNLALPPARAETTATSTKAGSGVVTARAARAPRWRKCSEAARLVCGPQCVRHPGCTIFRLIESSSGLNRRGPSRVTIARPMPVGFRSGEKHGRACEKQALMAWIAARARQQNPTIDLLQTDGADPGRHCVLSATAWRA